MVMNPIVGFIYPLQGFPIKGGMTIIPNIGSLDPGAHSNTTPHKWRHFLGKDWGAKDVNAPNYILKLCVLVVSWLIAAHLEVLSAKNPMREDSLLFLGHKWNISVSMFSRR